MNQTISILKIMGSFIVLLLVFIAYRVMFDIYVDEYFLLGGEQDLGLVMIIFMGLPVALINITISLKRIKALDKYEKIFMGLSFFTF